MSLTWYWLSWLVLRSMSLTCWTASLLEGTVDMLRDVCCRGFLETRALTEPCHMLWSERLVVPPYIRLLCFCLFSPLPPNVCVCACLQNRTSRKTNALAFRPFAIYFANAVGYATNARYKSRSPHWRSKKRQQKCHWQQRDYFVSFLCMFLVFFTLFLFERCTFLLSRFLAEHYVCSVKVVYFLLCVRLHH